MDRLLNMVSYSPGQHMFRFNGVYRPNRRKYFSLPQQHIISFLQRCFET